MTEAIKYRLIWIGRLLITLGDVIEIGWYDASHDTLLLGWCWCWVRRK